MQIHACSTHCGRCRFCARGIVLALHLRGCSVQCSRRLMRWLTMTGGAEECCREVSDKSVVEMC